MIDCALRLSHYGEKEGGGALLAPLLAFDALSSFASQFLTPEAMLRLSDPGDPTEDLSRVGLGRARACAMPGGRRRASHLMLPRWDILPHLRDKWRRN